VYIFRCSVFAELRSRQRLIILSVSRFHFYDISVKQHVKFGISWQVIVKKQ